MTIADVTAADLTTRRPAPLDAAPVDRSFAVASSADQPLSFAGRSSWGTSEARTRQQPFLIWEDFIMTQLWTFHWRRGKRARALRAPLRVELLEERNLLSGLHVVTSPTITNSKLLATTAIAANDT